jgi:hypothetical protein
VVAAGDGGGVPCEGGDVSDATWLVIGYLGCAALCATILSVAADNPKQARLALAVSLVWPLLALGVVLLCFFIIGESLFNLTRRAATRERGKVET